MKVLGLYWGANSNAALIIDGRIVGAVGEERFTRRKNESVFPAQSINWLLLEHGVTPADIDVVAIAGLQGVYDYILTEKYANYSIDDNVREQHEYWHKIMFEGLEVSYLDVFKDKLNVRQYPQEYWEQTLNSNKASQAFHADREEITAKFLNIPRSKVRRVDHHLCHASYGYFGSPFRNERCLVLTIDAFGDGLNMTINEADKGGVVRLHSSSTFHLGRLYRFMTLFLGMKPDEHEYKLMGLAPYAKAPVMKKAKEVFRSFQDVDGIDFKFVNKPKDLYFHYRDVLEGARFDGIAGALQEYVEEMLQKWVANVVNHFGVGRVVLSGGVSMNIKAMGKLAELPEVEELFVCGSSSDDSLAAGACYAVAAELFQAKGVSDCASRLLPLDDLYLGPTPGKSDPASVRATPDFREEFQIVSSPSLSQVVKLLASGKVIARCIGRGEFGARALGNRSILADPRNSAIVRVINDKIKSRDFWMPFAPMINDTYVPIYLHNPKNIFSPHMTIGFESTDEGKKAIPAALHAADLTARPQMVTPKQKEIYELLTAFERSTGVAGLLNTSLNLHGFPIVNSVADAMHVFSHSDLDALWLESSLVLKPGISL